MRFESRKCVKMLHHNPAGEAYSAPLDHLTEFGEVKGLVNRRKQGGKGWRSPRTEQQFWLWCPWRGRRCRTY